MHHLHFNARSSDSIFGGSEHHGNPRFPHFLGIIVHILGLETFISHVFVVHMIVTAVRGYNKGSYCA